MAKIVELARTRRAPDRLHHCEFKRRRVVVGPALVFCAEVAAQRAAQLKLDLDREVEAPRGEGPGPAAPSEAWRLWPRRRGSLPKNSSTRLRDKSPPQNRLPRPICPRELEKWTSRYPIRSS
jgi:hypothetical protein